jgi:hypothetical protein
MKKTCNTYFYFLHIIRLCYSIEIIQWTHSGQNTVHHNVNSVYHRRVFLHNYESMYTLHVCCYLHKISVVSSQWSVHSLQVWALVWSSACSQNVCGKSWNRDQHRGPHRHTPSTRTMTRLCGGTVLYRRHVFFCWWWCTHGISVLGCPSSE